MRTLGDVAVELAAERIRQLVAAVPMQLPQPGREVAVTVSIGIAEAHMGGFSA